MTAPLTKSFVSTHDPDKPVNIAERTPYRKYEKARDGGFVGEIVNLAIKERISTVSLLDKADEYAKGLLALGLIPGEDSIVSLGVCTVQALSLYVAALAVGIGYAHPDIHKPRENSIIIQISLVSPKVVVCGEGTGGLTLSALMNLFDGTSDEQPCSKLPFVKHMFYDDTYANRSPCQSFLQSLDKLIELGKSVADEKLMEAKQSVRPEFVAQHVFTSGSTGKPKCVSHTNTSICVDPFPMKLSSLMTTNLNTDSMACYGVIALTLAGEAGKAVMIPETYAEQSMADFGKIIAQGIVDEKIEYLCLTPGFLRILVDYLLKSELSLHTVKAAMFGGVPMTRSFNNDIQRCLNAPSFAGYGMSECFSIGMEKPGASTQSGGLMLEPTYYTRPYSELRLADDKDEVVNIGEVGEIQVKSLSILKEYKGDEQKTKELFTMDGFIKTGDMGVMNPDGGFVIKGRVGDGETLRFKIFNKVEYPGPIEQILTCHPDISEAAAIAGRRNEWMGDEVTCCIVLKPGAEKLREPELLEFFQLNGMNNDKQRPARIIYFDNFPTTANGRKVSKRELLKTVQGMIEEDENVGKCQWFIDLESSV